jgi:protein TonB
MADAARRRMMFALLASLLAHAGLLAPAFRLPQRPSAMAAQPLVALIAERAPVPGDAGAAGASPAAPAASRRAAGGDGPTAASRLPAPARPVVEQPAASPADDSRATRARRADSPPRSSPPASSVAASAAGSAAAGTAAADAGAAAAPPLAGISADDLRQYRIELAIAARRYQRYPDLARERGWAGRVEVAVRVSAWQPRPHFSLARSSGHAPLDRQAVAMLEQAAAAAPLPAGLRGRDFSLVLPVEFTLDDAR